jgi:hypothetical protein
MRKGLNSFRNAKSANTGYTLNALPTQWGLCAGKIRRTAFKVASILFVVVVVVGILVEEDKDASHESFTGDVANARTSLLWEGELEKRPYRSRMESALDLSDEDAECDLI